MSTLRFNHTPYVASQPQASKHMQRGIGQIADVLAPTLGPLGGPVVYSETNPQRLETLDDAATIVRRIISLGSPQIDIGAMLIRNVVWRVERRIGDGGATTAVLLRALFEGGLRQVAAGANAMQLMVGIRQGMEVALEALAAQARPAGDENQLAAVARTVTRDDDLSAILGELSYLLGADAHVLIETFVAPYLQRAYLAGAHYKAKIASMYFYSDAQRKRAVLTAPAVAVLDEPLTTTEQAVRLMEAAIRNERSTLFVVTPQLSGAALNLLVSNHVLPEDKRKLSMLVVGLGPVGEERAWALADLCLLSGATLIGAQGIHHAASLLPADLGQAQRVEFADDAIMVVAEGNRRAAVQGEVAAVRRRLGDLPLDDDQVAPLTRRLAALSGGVGQLKIGAYGKQALEMRRVKAERGLKVLSAVQRGGVVPGGGSALLHCAQAVRQAAAEVMATANEEVVTGMRVLADALSAPARQIMVNAGLTAPALILNQLAEAGAPAAYDVEQARVVDAHAAGVLDAADVVAGVLQAAVSGALMALSTDAIVYHRNPQQSLNP